MGTVYWKTIFIVFLATTRLLSADELLLAQHIWRHGDRAPVSTYPNDVHQASAWPLGFGELTSVGMRQQYALGQLVRKQYITGSNKFLSANYNPEEIYIRSTDVNRTLVSALSNLAGMYPSGVSGIDSPVGKLPSNWTPIPIHTFDYDTDYIGNIFAKCPRANQLTNLIYASKTNLKIVKMNQDIFDFFTKKTGMEVDIKSVHKIFDAYFVETVHNMSQPEWMTDESVILIKMLSRIGYHYLYGVGVPYLPPLIKLRGGSALKMFVDHMKQKLDCASKTDDPGCKWMRKLKYYALSAHDTTVGAVLATLGNHIEILEGGLPQYSGSLGFELWNTTKYGLAVRMLYHKGFNDPFDVITQLTEGCPNDSDFCPFEQFVERSKKFMPNNIEEDCREMDPKQAAQEFAQLEQEHERKQQQRYQ